jgi:hypothetical protein
LEQTIARGGGALVGERSILRALGIPSASGLEVRDLLAWLLEAVANKRDSWREVVTMILREGTLSERILRATGMAPTRRRLKAVYGRLADGLDRGVVFQP